MAADSPAGDRSRAEFVDVDLSGARFVRVDLSGAVMRAVHVRGADIDAPWLLDGESSLVINGVDVVPFIEAELDRRFPGREQRRADDPQSLRAAWGSLERAWAETYARVAAMPAGTVDESVDGEWSFAQTLRHLVMATDAWLRGAVLGIDQPFHPLGQPNVEYETDGNDMSVFTPTTPAYVDVLRAREDRVALVRDFLATVTSRGARPDAPQPVGTGPPGDDALLPAGDPRGGVGAPAIRRTGSRCPRGPRRQVTRHPLAAEPHCDRSRRQPNRVSP